MSTYLLTLTPQEPYFFGNEKSFEYPGQKKSGINSQYYIKSEAVPAQTSLIGVLRYILLPVKKDFGKYDSTDLKKNGEAVGERSFKYGSENKFGKIKHISAVFMVKDGKRLVPTPFDHKKSEKKYTPFSEYTELCDGTDRIYPTDYNAKDGICHSYMCIDGDENEYGTIYKYEDVFKSDLRVGINRFKDESGFFKKEYSALYNGFSFAAYVTLEDITPTDTVVYMGQGKSLFIARFLEVEDNSEKEMTEKIRGLLKSNVSYCLSDIFCKSEIYSKTKFSVTDVRNYRAFTVTDGRIQKGSKLYRLISAGSIFIMKDKEYLKKLEDKNLTVIGYNTVI